MHAHTFIPRLSLVLLILGGCAAPPKPAEEPRDVVDGNLVYRKDGYMDLRTGWLYPQTLPGNFSATQAWDLERAVIGIGYAAGAPAPTIAMDPVAVPSTQAGQGTVAAIAYPVGSRIGDLPSFPDIGNLPRQLGLGHGHAVAEEEFWAYQRSLEGTGYHLHKLVRLADQGGRAFQSLLVLKVLDPRRTDALVVTVGEVDGVYSLVVIRRFVRTQEDVDAFGDWAYGILREFGLLAVKG